jgi:putative spermidine/putrescine transport system substrate-binding protein
MVAAALASGGSVSNFEPARTADRLQQGRRAHLSSNEAFAQALKTEEIACGIMWKARAVQWQNAGIKVATWRQGRRADVRLGLRMPKNAPNKDGAYAWLDAMMAASAQENFAIDMGYNPTVTNAKVAPDCRRASASAKRSRSAWSTSTTATWAKNDVAFQDWWNKSFKG